MWYLLQEWKCKRTLWHEVVVVVVVVAVMARLTSKHGTYVRMAPGWKGARNDMQPKNFRNISQAASLNGWQLWASCSHTCASVTKQYNLVPAKGRWRSAAGKVSVGLASHWPCVTDSVVYPSTGSKGNVWELSTPPALRWSMVPFTLYHNVREYLAVDDTPCLKKTVQTYFLLELCQISTYRIYFGHTDSRENKLFWGVLIFHLT